MKSQLQQSIFFLKLSGTNKQHIILKLSKPKKNVITNLLFIMIFNIIICKHYK